MKLWFFTKIRSTGITYWFSKSYNKHGTKVSLASAAKFFNKFPISFCMLFVLVKATALAEPNNILFQGPKGWKKNLSIIIISSRIEICKHYNYPPKSNQSFSLRWTFYHRYWGARALGRKYSGCQLVLSLRHSAKASLLQLGRSWHHWKSAYVTADTRLIQIGGGKVKWRYWSHHLFVVETSSWNSNLKRS